MFNKKISIIILLLSVIILNQFILFAESKFIEKGKILDVITEIHDNIWPMFCHDSTHSGQSNFGHLGNFGVENWKFWMNGKTISSPAIENNGTIYIGASDSHNSFYAIYPNGTEKWRFDAGSWIQSSPAISIDGTIYVGSDSGTLYAIYPNGTKKWETQIGSGWVYSSPVIDTDGTIYCASVGSNRLCAVSPNGTIKWYFNTEDSIYCSPTIGDDGFIFIGSNDGYTYCIFPNGTMSWKYYCGGQSGVAGVAIGEGGIIYCGSTSGYLYALYPNGTLRWKISIGWIGTCPVVSQTGTIYVGDENYHRIYSIAPNGTINWYYQAYDDILSSPAIDKYGNIYCGSYDDYLYALTQNGTLLWKFDAADEGILSSPVIGENGTIYIAGTYPPTGTQSSFTYLYALEIINNSAPAVPTIQGQKKGKIWHTYDYIFVTTDSDNDNISYYIDWGDGKTTDWIGPYDSCEEIIQSHTWLIRGTYEVKVKARDGHGMESDWGTLSVTMPYEPPQFPFIQWLLERFPNAFPLLRYLLKY